MIYYFKTLKKYAVFKGRAELKEYWIFFACNVTISIILTIIEGLIGLNLDVDRNFFAHIFSSIMVLPSLAVTVRRMHDVNKSGWYSLVPIYNLLFLITNGTKGDNKYGPDPKVIKSD